MAADGPVEYMSRKQVPELIDALVLRMVDARPEDPRAFMAAVLAGSPPPTDSPGQVQLFLMRLSANCHGVWLTCRLGGVEHEVRDVDLFKGENMAPEFLAINPTGQIPALKDSDGTCVFQGNAVMRYLCNKFLSARKLYPADLRQRAHCDMALDWRNTDLVPQIYGVAGAALGFFPPDEAKAAAAHAKFNDADRGIWKVFTSHFLGSSLYVCGDDISIADLAIFPMLTMLEMVDYELPSAVKAYKERCWAETGYEELYNGCGGYGLKQHMDTKRSEG